MRLTEDQDQFYYSPRYTRKEEIRLHKIFEEALDLKIENLSEIAVLNFTREEEDLPSINSKQLKKLCKFLISEKGSKITKVVLNRHDLRRGQKTEIFANMLRNNKTLQYLELRDCRLQDEDYDKMMPDGISYFSYGGAVVFNGTCKLLGKTEMDEEYIRVYARKEDQYYRQLSLGKTPRVPPISKKFSCRFKNQLPEKTSRIVRKQIMKTL